MHVYSCFSPTPTSSRMRWIFQWEEVQQPLASMQKYDLFHWSNPHDEQCQEIVVSIGSLIDHRHWNSLAPCSIGRSNKLCPDPIRFGNWIAVEFDFPLRNHWEEFNEQEDKEWMRPIYSNREEQRRTLKSCCNSCCDSPLRGWGTCLNPSHIVLKVFALDQLCSTLINSPRWSIRSIFNSSLLVGRRFLRSSVRTLKWEAQWCCLQAMRKLFKNDAVEDLVLVKDDVPSNGMQSTWKNFRLQEKTTKWRVVPRNGMNRGKAQHCQFRDGERFFIRSSTKDSHPILSAK